MKTVENMIELYTMLKANHSSTTMYEEIKWRYIGMANGGNGGSIYPVVEGKSSCRELNYPDYPDSFFQSVCDGVGWKYK